MGYFSVQEPATAKSHRRNETCLGALSRVLRTVLEAGSEIGASWFQGTQNESCHSCFGDFETTRASSKRSIQKETKGSLGITWVKRPRNGLLCGGES